ncbi:MAG: beta strand repeat-containing protein, partial [Bacteroidales bacterium]
MKKSLLFLFAMVFSLVGWGQSTANYTFSTSTTGSLVLDANTNAVDMSTGTTQLIAPSSDATVSSVTNIGFNFFFMGNNYTQFSASADGWIGLGSIAVSGTTNSGASTTTPKITAMGGDLYVGASGKVHYKLIGTAPNRCLVIEFNNLAVYYSTTAGNAVNVYQVRLYETTSIIEYIYGNMYCGLTTYSPGYVGFGSGTAANTQLSVTTSTNTVSTGSTFNTNAYTAATNIANLYSVLNGSRRIYKFTPQSTTPTDPITMTFSSIAASGMTVNWIDNSTTETYFTLIRATDVGFTQNVVTSNINSTTIAGTGNSYNSGAITGLTPSTTYYFKVIASNEASVPSFGITGSQTTNSPLIYTWNQTASAVYATAANWTPTRTTPDATDILVFDGASTPAPIVTGVTTQTIGQLKLLNNANVQIQGSSTTLTLVGGTGDDFVIPSGSTLQINGASSLSIAYSGSGHVGNIAGTLSLSGSTSNSYSASNSTTSVTGTINNFGSITGSISSLIFSNGSIYNHNYTTSAGTIPTATWNATSNCNIISYTSNTSAPSGIAQTFGNFTWNCTGQTGNLSLAGSAIVANGTFTMSSTNTGSLRMVASSGSGSIVANNFTQTGGSLDFSSGSSSGTLKVAGTFNQSAGTITESGTGTANTIEFNGSTNQSVTFGGTLTNTLSYRINNNAGITLSGTMAIT